MDQDSRSFSTEMANRCLIFYHYQVYRPPSSFLSTPPPLFVDLAEPRTIKKLMCRLWPNHYLD